MAGRGEDSAGDGGRLWPGRVCVEGGGGQRESDGPLGTFRFLTFPSQGPGASSQPFNRWGYCKFIGVLPRPRGKRVHHLCRCEDATGNWEIISIRQLRPLIRFQFLCVVLSVSLPPPSLSLLPICMR